MRSSSEYKLVLSDSYIIDGLPSAEAQANPQSSMSGAYANHPPAHVVPNAMFYDVCCDSRDLPAASVSALARATWYAVAPLSFDGQRYVRTAFLVALRDIEDEEIFIDYKFDPDAPTPLWYTPTRSGSAGPSA